MDRYTQVVQLRKALGRAAAAFGEKHGGALPDSVVLDAARLFLGDVLGRVNKADDATREHIRSRLRHEVAAIDREIRDGIQQFFDEDR